MFDPSNAPRDCREPMSNDALAARFGRTTLNGMIGGKSPAWVYEHARLAASYARMALAEREPQLVRHATVHPILRDLVNLTAEIYGIPAPTMVEPEQEDSRWRR